MTDRPQINQNHPSDETAALVRAELHAELAAGCSHKGCDPAKFGPVSFTRLSDGGYACAAGCPTCGEQVHLCIDCPRRNADGSIVPEPDGEVSG